MPELYNRQEKLTIFLTMGRLLPDRGVVYSSHINDRTKQPMNDSKKTQRLSYLLRLWRTEGLGDFEWRASLEIPGTGQRLGNLEQLFVFLMDLTEGQATTRPGTEKTETRKRNREL
jgi:hypothetical protein